MKFQALALLASVASAATAAPAPHCQFAPEPAIVCNEASQAARAWHIYGRNLATALDSNNRALLHQANCAVVHGPDIAHHLILEHEDGRLPTQWGWTRIAQITIDTRLTVYVAAGYLRGTCELWSTAGDARDRLRLGLPPTLVPAAPTGDMPDASTYHLVPPTPVGQEGRPGGSFP